MTDEVDNISGKLKDYLTRKLNESKIKIKKLKRKRNINKIIIYSSTICSIVISSIIASISLLLVVPVFVVTILSISSAILTGISARFNFQDKTIVISREIDRLNKLQAKLDYVVSCNGDLTKQEYQEILKEFNF
jgi:hypothetical protein